MNIYIYIYIYTHTHYIHAHTHTLARGAVGSQTRSPQTQKHPCILNMCIIITVIITAIITIVVIIMLFSFFNAEGPPI